MHDKPVNKIENKTEEREEDTEKFYVAEEGVPLYICDQNALIAYYGSEIELNRTIVSPREMEFIRQDFRCWMSLFPFGVWKGACCF